MLCCAVLCALQAVPSWFVKVTEFKDRLLAANAGTYWVPRHVKDGRFHNWLESARDWCVCSSAVWLTHRRPKPGL